MATKVISPHAVREQLGIAVDPPTLSPVQKMQVAENKVELYFIGGKAGVLGQYGESYLFTAMAAKYRFKFFMSSPEAQSDGENVHPEVDAEYTWLCENASESTPIGPYVLDYITMKNGQSFYRLSPADPIPSLDGSAQESLPF